MSWILWELQNCAKNMRKTFEHFCAKVCCELVFKCFSIFSLSISLFMQIFICDDIWLRNNSLFCDLLFCKTWRQSFLRERIKSGQIIMWNAERWLKTSKQNLKGYVRSLNLRDLPNNSRLKIYLTLAYLAFWRKLQFLSDRHCL